MRSIVWALGTKEGLKGAHRPQDGRGIVISGGFGITPITVQISQKESMKAYRNEHFQEANTNRELRGQVV